MILSSCQSQVLLRVSDFSSDDFLRQTCTTLNCNALCNQLEEDVLPVPASTPVPRILDPPHIVLATSVQGAAASR